MAAKKTAKKVVGKKSTEKAKPATGGKCASYKALMVLKGRGLLERGIKVKADMVRGTISWITKQGETFFSMSLSDYAETQAKNQGFAVA